MRFPVLFLVTILLLVLYTFLCVSRLVPGHEVFSGLTSIGGIFFIIRFQLFHSREEIRSPVRHALTWISSVLLGLWSSFIILCIFVDAANLFLVALQILGLESAYKIQHTHWQSNAIRVAFCLSMITSVIGLSQAIKGPVIKRVSIPISSLPEELVGFKIVQISDLHIGAIIQKKYIERVVSQVSALSPDIIAITGDIADGKPHLLQEHTQPLAYLKAQLGVYYITGNHEYYSGVHDWMAEAERLHFIPLINENRIVEYKGKKVMIAGVTDISAHLFIPEHLSDPFKAIASEIACDVKVLLAHQPESNVKAEAAGFDVQLSGHTHAGQYFPFSLLVSLAKRYAKGAYRYKNLWIYVNPGTGFWGAANRFAVPAEITLLEFVKG